MTKSLLTVLGDREALYEIEQKNTRKEYSRFILFSTILRNLKYILPIVAILVAFGVLIMLTLLKNLGIVFLLIAIIIPIFMISWSILMARRYIKKNSWYLTYTNTYRVFDELLYIRSDNKKRYSESVVSYESLHRFYQTQTNFYLYITKSRCIIISKENMKEMDIESFVRFFARRMCPKKMKNGFGFRLKLKKRR